MHIYRVNRRVGLGLAVCPTRCLSYSVTHAQIQYLFIVNMSSADQAYISSVSVMEEIISRMDSLFLQLNPFQIYKIQM